MQLAGITIYVDPITGTVFAQSSIAEACKNEQVRSLITDTVDILVNVLNELEG